MNKNKQYLFVGLFIIITAIILFGVWLWFGSSNRQAYNTYVAVFTEPVDGVTSDSVIRYNGVEVGKVKLVELDSKNPRNVFVYLDVLQNVPIYVDTYASIKSQGVTGMSYINLSLPQSSGVSSVLQPHNEAPYPQIPTRPSLLYSLSEQAQSLTNNIQDVSLQIKTLLNDQNINHVSAILANLDKISSSIASRSDKLSQSLDTLAELLKSVKSNSQNLNTTFDHLSQLTQSLAKTSDNANQLILSAQNNTLRNVNAVLLPNLNQTISHLNQSSYQLEQFLQLLNQNPAALIRGKTAASPGPGEH